LSSAISSFGPASSALKRLEANNEMMATPSTVHGAYSRGGTFSAIDTLTLAIWLAMAAGLIEGSYRLYQSYGLGTVIGMSPHVIWMAPVANLVWLLVPVGLILVVGGFLHRRPSILSVFLLYFIAAVGLVLLYRGLHPAAAVLLAAGVASRLAPWTLRSTRFRRVVRRTLPILVALPVLVGVAIAARRWENERRLVAALPVIPAERPNVLLIIWDTVRDFSTGLGGYSRPTTPFLEQMSREGARFELALAPAPWTLPSIASMFTGQRPSAMSGRLTVPLDQEHPVIAEAFASAGYVTGGFVANTFYCSREHGLARGFHHYEDFRISIGGILGVSSRLGAMLLRSDVVRRVIGYFDLPGRKKASQVNQEFLRWVSQGETKPFFAFLNYFDAHLPFVAREPFRSRFSFDLTSPFRPRPGDVTFGDMAPGEVEWSMGEYDATIAYQDAQVEELLRELESRGLLDNTVVVITSDHGEHFGEFGRISHGNTLYRQLLQVPLVIRFPRRVPEGTVVATPASLSDLPQTLLDLTQENAYGTFPGKSLARFWEGENGTASAEVVLSEMPTASGTGAYSLVANGYHYVRWFDTPAELYYLADDPRETRNLAGSPSAAGMLAEFARLETEYVRLPLRPPQAIP
jgi:arylsulfatase A-like enzyme